jgi:methionyl-tRNA formyltransferase
MTNTSKTIVFFGTDDFSAAALRHLIEADYTIAAVVTQPDRKRGRGQQLQKPAVKVLAEAHHISIWQPASLLDIAKDLRALQPVAGVLSSFGRIIPADILKLFEPGIINVHPSLLPAYRGPTPIESTILQGDSHAGVSIMQLVEAMDAGPVYAQTSYPLDGTETQAELYDRLSVYGGALLVQHLPRILNHTLQPTPQDDTKATYTKLLTKADATPDPSQWTADALARKVRAHNVFPKTKLTLLGQLVVVTAAHVGDDRADGLIVQCKDDTTLVIDTLIGPSGKTMSADDFIRGYGQTT